MGKGMFKEPRGSSRQLCTEARPLGERAGRRLFVFDMDGTLIMNSTGNVEISKVNGTEQFVEQLEERYNHGYLDTKDFSQSLYQKWGPLEPSVLQRAFRASKKIRNIRRVMSHISQTGGLSCIITMSQDVFANFFLDYGVDYVFATYYPNDPGEPYDRDKALEPADKLRIAKEICRANGIAFEATAAFGDSLSDEPLFERLEETVCVNGFGTLRSMSKYSYTGDDLWAAYRLLDTVVRSADHASSRSPR